MVLITEELIGEKILGPEEYTMEIYYESETHEKLVEYRINEVLKKYSHLFYDSDYMNAIANTQEAVRIKFDNLRALNTDLEEKRKDSAITSAKGRNDHISELISFMWAYVDALKVNRETEITLIKNLPSILNKEFGNLTSLEQIPELFIEGAITNPIKLVSKIGTEAFSLIAEGVLGKNWKRNLTIGIIIIIAIIALSLIGFTYTKSYIGAKATKKAIK